MPAKPKGGKRQQRQHQDANYARELILKEEGESYALVLKEMGNRVLRVYCFEDQKTRRAHIPKKIRERMHCGDVILVTPRDYSTDDEDWDIFNKYSKEEIKQLQEFNYIPKDLDTILENESSKIGVNAKEEMKKLMQEQIEEQVVPQQQQQRTQQDLDDL